MAQIYAVFSDGDFLRMVGSDESVIFFDPWLSWTSSLTDVHFFALTGDAVYDWHF
jgi:hypothetical protein